MLDSTCTIIFMSSLAAARADNFYYPPEWDPKKGGLNKFHGQHALRERARKIDQGILIISFEMPYNIWCGGCGSMIAKGVQFNAENKQISDARHFDDYSINKSLRAKLRNQKKRVAEEELAARKIGLGIRLLPASEEDTAAAKCVKFSSNFVINLSNEWLRHII
ncbi:putative saf4/Yju2 protein [Helianthus debilis subsp. tardiflorus]